MYTSVLDLFSIGIGPSSSHTVGPMRSAYAFASKYKNEIQRAASVTVELYGSLALTGSGHSTDKAIILGLVGYKPEEIIPEQAEEIYRSCLEAGKLQIAGKIFPFSEGTELIFVKTKFLPYHSNGMIFKLSDDSGKVFVEKDYYSIGGGFVIDGETASKQAESSAENSSLYEPVKHEFNSAKDLLLICERENLDIPGVMLANEDCLRPREETEAGIQLIWAVMNECIEISIKTEGILPGGLNVRRRAAKLYKKIHEERESGNSEPASVKDWICLYALAVNEENAAGGRVVTAPTNGAAGVIPAVFRYYMDFVKNADISDAVRFFLTATAIGNLYKKNASISAAEVGCQGEIGVACSMAAAALAQLRGGTPHQVENAAEIAMEHHLGLTCDPIGGLVQIPCIERNTIGANTAVTASRLALNGDGDHIVGLDAVIKTMFITGKEMSGKYKETSEGGLAVNSIEC